MDPEDVDADYQNLLGDLEAVSARLADARIKAGLGPPVQPAPQQPPRGDSSAGTDDFMLDGSSSATSESSDEEDRDSRGQQATSGAEGLSDGYTSGYEDASDSEEAPGHLDYLLDQYLSVQTALRELQHTLHVPGIDETQSAAQAAAQLATGPASKLVPTTKAPAATGTAAAAAQQNGLGQEDWFQELPPGAPLPEGRLGQLYAALDANRRLAAHLRDVVAPQVERALDQNWEHACAVKGVHQGLTAASKARGGQGRSKRSLAADPLRGATGPHGQQHAPATSRFWVVQGEVPDPNADTLHLAGQLRSLPATFERTRWRPAQVAALKIGVTAEIQAHLTEQALKTAQSQLLTSSAAPPGGGPQGAGAGAAPPQLSDLTQRFQEIQAVQAESQEGDVITAGFTEAQWSRISSAHVKDRSHVDCKIYWLNYVRSRAWTAEESQRLQVLVTELGNDKWAEVATRLGTGRTPVQCLQTWVKSSRPEGHARDKQIWTPEDMTHLQQLVAEMGTKWVKISEAFGGRWDRHQLRDRWHAQTSLGGGERKVGRWSADEDDRLLKAVEQHSTSWRAVAKAVGTRSSQQCRERYENVLNPALRSGPWTPEEEIRFKAAVQSSLKENGRIMWSKVAAQVGGRTDDMCRRAWKQLQATGSVQAKPKAGGKSRSRRATSSALDASVSGGREASGDDDELGDDAVQAREGGDGSDGEGAGAGAGRGGGRRGRGRGRGRGRAASRGQGQGRLRGRGGKVGVMRASSRDSELEDQEEGGRQRAARQSGAGVSRAGVSRAGVKRKRAVVDDDDDEEEEEELDAPDQAKSSDEELGHGGSEQVQEAEQQDEGQGTDGEQGGGRRRSGRSRKPVARFGDFVASNYNTVAQSLTAQQEQSRPQGSGAGGSQGLEDDCVSSSPGSDGSRSDSSGDGQAGSESESEGVKGGVKRQGRARLKRQVVQESDTD